MTVLKTQKQMAREERNKFAIQVFKEVERTCMGSMNQKCIETARRLKKQFGYEVGSITIYKLVKNDKS
jgi:hypothetical protein